MPLALHAPLPLPCWPQGARLGPLPFPLLLPLSWQLLAQLQPDTVLGPVPLIAGWLLICFSTGPRSPGNGMLHGSPAPEPRSMVGTTMLRLELERSATAGLLPCCLAAQCWGRDAPYTSLPEWVRTSSCLTLPSLPCCVLGAGDPALLPCWGPAHDNPPGTPQTAAVVSCPRCIPGVSVPHAPHPGGIPWGWHHPQLWAGSVCRWPAQPGGCSCKAWAQLPTKELPATAILGPPMPPPKPHPPVGLP